ncbi:MAG: PQQ-binding-like beta-propeller repeat protein, partial [Bacteroidales bacterium]|nr:PQQ-binding-like beta-propeller repeat protein [Bacteroidales bacterium]
ADGRLLWEYETGEQVVASPVVSGGRFFILTAKGSLLCFGESSSSQS